MFYGTLPSFQISDDDEILPGFDGKLISWVVEDHGV